jgi:1-acyl-sn-glycerol-3-phosphate acyltransferase
MQILRNLFFYSVTVILVIILAPPLLIFALLPDRMRYDNKFFYACLHLLYRGVVFALWIPVKIYGKNNIPKSPVIFVANHQSAFDIPLIGMLMGMYPHLWMYKSELDSVPVLGFLTRRFGVSVDRTLARQGARALFDALRLIQGKNRHIIIFPEGERFSDGKVHEFLSGFALLAEKAERPVVPIYLQNVYKVCPAGHFSVNYAQVSITIGHGLIRQPDETAQDFTHRVQQWFIQRVQEQRS